MKPITLYILLTLLVGALLWMFFTKESGHNQKLQRIEKAYADSIESIRSEYDSILLVKDREALAAFVGAQNAANKMEGEANFWKEQARKEKVKNRVFTSVQTDSLLSLVH